MLNFFLYEILNLSYLHDNFCVYKYINFDTFGFFACFELISVIEPQHSTYLRTKPTKAPNSAQSSQIAHKGAQQRTKMLKAILRYVKLKLRLELKALKKPGTNGRKCFVSDPCILFLYKYDVGKKRG
jgi:hypothetical protein